MTLLYAVLLLGAVLSLAIVPVRWHVQNHGVPVEVTVTGKYVSHSNKHGDTYYVKFTYPFEGETISDSQRVNTSEYDRAEPGDRANGKAARILGLGFCLTSLGAVDRETRTWIFITGLWNVIGWTIFGVAAFKIIQARRLVQRGVAVPGTVTNRRLVRGRSTYRYVAYQFTTTNGEALSAERAVSMAGYNRVDIGSRATVLYDAEDPSKSIVYECSNYEVDDDADAPSDTTKA